MRQLLLYACIVALCAQCSAPKSIATGWQPSPYAASDTDKIERYWFSLQQELYQKIVALRTNSTYTELYLFEPKHNIRFTERADTSLWSDAVLVAALKPSQVFVTVKPVAVEVNLIIIKLSTIEIKFL